MARIAGIYSDHTRPPHGLLAALLNNLSGKAKNNCHRSWREGAHLSMGGIGSSPLCLRRQSVIAVMDGWFELRDKPAVADLHQLVELYQRVGFEKMLCQIRGDFAIALFDSQSNTLWLGRDRLGVKPLYYSNQPHFFSFASKPAALLSVPGVSNVLNPSFVGLFAGAHYRAIDNDPCASPYASVKQLPGAHYIKVSHGKVSDPIAYWRVEQTSLDGVNEITLVEQYRELLQRSVARRLRASTRPAFALSGGMDSSSVLATAVQLSGKRQSAFSAIYDDIGRDSPVEIQGMLSSSVSSWYPVSVNNPDVFQLVDEMIAIHEEPVVTATCLSHYLMCQQIRSKGFRGVFGGLGGDELNAGGHEHFLYYFADLKSAGNEVLFNQEVDAWIKSRQHSFGQTNRRVVEEELHRLVDLSVSGRVLADRSRLGCYQQALNPDFFEMDKFSPVMDEWSESYLNNRAFQSLFRETIPGALRAEDRHCEHFGLENFDPFLDDELVSFMLNVPGELKIKNGLNKGLLRSAMKGMLPEETRLRVEKIGWNAPDHLWFSGQSLEHLQDMIHSLSFRQRGIYQVNEVERLLREHQSLARNNEQQGNHQMFFWQLINLERWIQKTDVGFSQPLPEPYMLAS